MSKLLFTGKDADAMNALAPYCALHYYSIGLDPGVKTGFCLYDNTARKIVKLCTLEFWEVFDIISQLNDSYITGIKRLKFVIENPALNKPTFNKEGGNTALKMQKIAQNVGYNKREAMLLIEGIRRLGYEVKEVVPSKKSAYKGKITKQFFNKLSGWTGSSSQHARDAGMLVIT